MVIEIVFYIVTLLLALYFVSFVAFVVVMYKFSNYITEEFERW